MQTVLKDTSSQGCPRALVLSCPVPGVCRLAARVLSVEIRDLGRGKCVPSSRLNLMQGPNTLEVLSVSTS